MDPIKNRLTMFEQIRNKFRKKKEKQIVITTYNPYNIHNKNEQSWNNLAIAIKNLGLSAEKASRNLADNMSTINKFKKYKD